MCRAFVLSCNNTYLALIELITKAGINERRVLVW